jgi:cytochrome bd-type quinol oxidase subunit 1
MAAHVRFWRKIFGIGFAIGVVSGIVLTFEFGLNWRRFAHDVGSIIGVIIAMEVAWAFFLETGFLGLLVYGDGRELAERGRDVLARRRGGDDSHRAACERELVA